MRKRLIVAALVAALSTLGLQGVASADPEPGSNTGNSFVCNGPDRPPTCPPRND
jgi:hypothetical protein